MGLLKHLLFWPVTGPNFLLRFSLEKVEDTVREELTNDHAVKEELLALQMRLELEEITDEEYVELEAALMQRLRDVRHWREQFGMGTSGGPVRVAPAIDAAEDQPGLAETAVATPDPAEADPRDPENPQRGGIASPEGASVEISLDWE
jgi:hypothetical protein